MKRTAAWCAVAILVGCTTPLPTGTQVLSLAALKFNPQTTLQEYGGKRLRTAGYFMVDHLAPDCQYFQTPDPEGRRPTTIPMSLVDLDLSRSKFEQAVHRWVVIDATIRGPKNMELGGGDLVIQVPEYDQDIYLDDGMLVSIDVTKPICRP